MVCHYVERLDAQGEALFASLRTQSGQHRPTRADSSYKASWRPEWVKVKNELVAAKGVEVRR
jgi:hypothetical protein